MITLKRISIHACFLFLLCFVSSYAFSQEIAIATHAQYKNFVNSTTYVVKNDNPFGSYNAAIEQAMKKHWYLTKYVIITSSEFEKKRTDRDASFLFLSEAIAEKREDLRFNILNVVMGSKSSNMNNMPDLGSVPLSYSFEDEEFEDEGYLYRIGAILRFIQYYIDVNSKRPDTDIKTLVKENSKDIKSKEIWFVKDDLDNDVNTEAKIANFYSGQVRIVTESEIEAAIDARNPDVLILHKLGPGEGNSGKCLKFIISAADGIPYYYNITEISSKNPDAFLSSDFKKL